MHLTDPNAFIFGGPNEVELWRQSNLDGEQKGGSGSHAGYLQEAPYQAPQVENGDTIARSSRQDRSALSSVFSLLMLPLTSARMTLPPRGNDNILLQWCHRRRLPYLCISLLIPFELVTPRRARPPSGRAQSCHWAARGRWPRSSPLRHTSSPSPLDTFTRRWAAQSQARRWPRARRRLRWLIFISSSVRNRRRRPTWGQWVPGSAAGGHGGATRWETLRKCSLELDGWVDPGEQL
jgi:hypothetical protein